MHWEQKVQYATNTDVGMRRKNNQDSLVVQTLAEQEVWEKKGHLFVVADGMGGHAVGELASKIAVDTIPLTFLKSRARDIAGSLIESVEHANAAIYRKGSENLDFKRMGTTCVVLALGPSGASIAHVGDSRCYRVRKDRIEQVTFDHSLEWELRRQGTLKPGDVFLPEAKHVITRSLGPEEKVQVDVDGPHPVLPGDQFVLCSDGLTGDVADAEIGMIVRELPPDEASKLLVNLANLRGGSDNTTVIVVRVEAGPNDSPEPVLATGTETTTWGWLLGFWFSILLCVVGTYGIVNEYPVQGAGGATAGLLAIMLLLRRWYRSREPEFRELPETTIHARVYTSTRARTTKVFLQGLAKLERELKKLAIEENWKVDWEEHDKQLDLAREALDTKKGGGAAMSHLGQALDILTLGLHARRKQQRLRQMAQDDKSDG